MITLIHGTDQVTSREKLTDLVDKHNDSHVVRLGGDIDAVGFRESCEARPLLAEKTLVVVEAATVKELEVFDDQLLSYMEELPKSADVIFWVGKKVAKNRKFYKAVQSLGKIFFFEEVEEKPFDFLDALAANNQKKAYLELWKLLKQGESEIKIVQLIAWELRTLIRVKDSEGNPGLHPFVYKKSKKFTKNFTLDKLRNLFEDATHADLDMKTGKDPRLVLDTLIYHITKN